MTRDEAQAILSTLWPEGGGTVSWDDLIPIAEEIKRLQARAVEWWPYDTLRRDGRLIMIAFQNGEVSFAPASRGSVVEVDPGFDHGWLPELYAEIPRPPKSQK